MSTNEILNGSITQADLGFTLPVSQWQNNGQKIFYSGGNVGIGTNDPFAPLQVVNTTAVNEAILGVGSVTGAGVAGLGDNFVGVPTNKTGVYGSAVNGVIGIGVSNTIDRGTGVWGIGQGNDAVGIVGQAGVGNNTLAGYFQGPVRTDGFSTISTTGGQYKVVSEINSAGSGSVITIGNNGSYNIRLSSGFQGESGFLGIYGPADFPGDQPNSRISLYANDTGEGYLHARNKVDESSVFLGSSSSTGSGFVTTYGPGLPNSNSDEKVNVTLSNLDGYPNNGFVSVRDYNATNTGTTSKAGMFLDANGHGRVFVRNQAGTTAVEMGFSSNGTPFLSSNVKNFRMVHPRDHSKEIWYACIEGPEAAAYERGTASLTNGVATVTFSEHFQAVANPSTMTVILTPLSEDSKGMAVIEKTASGFRVKELMRGNGNYQFDWEVKCVRQGYEDYQAIRPRENNLAEPAKFPAEGPNIAQPDNIPLKGLPASTYNKQIKKQRVIDLSESHLPVC